MTLTFVELPAFTAKWRTLRLSDLDLLALQSIIMLNPEAGKVMAGTRGLRKVRFAPPSWHVGKSGATRVCYSIFPAVEAVYFFTIYGKNEKDNLTQAERNYYAKVLKAFETWLSTEKELLP